MKLKDPSLLQTRCLIDGQWLDADSGKTIAVTNPGLELGIIQRDHPLLPADWRAVQVYLVVMSFCFLFFEME